MSIAAAAAGPDGMTKEDGEDEEYTGCVKGLRETKEAEEGATWR